MTKPFTSEIDEALAERSTRIARRAKGFDRQGALAWLRELADKSPAAVDDGDRLPKGYSPQR